MCSVHPSRDLYAPDDSILTARDSKEMATRMVKNQLASPAILMALGRGPCRNSSAPIMVGMGPERSIINVG